MIENKIKKNNTRQCPTLTQGDLALPSALKRFTSEFGMDSGGTITLLLPGLIFFRKTPLVL